MSLSPVVLLFICDKEILNYLRYYQIYNSHLYEHYYKVVKVIAMLVISF